MNKFLFILSWVFSIALLNAQTANITQQKGSLESAYTSEATERISGQMF